MTNLDELTELFEVYNFDLTSTRNEEGKTLLHLAVEEDDVPIVEYLLDKGVKVNVHDIHGDTPLHYTIRKGYTYLSQILIKNGAGVNAKNSNGQTPIFYAVNNDDENSIILLIDHGADLGVYDNNGKLPIHYAIEEGNLNSIDLLIKNGTDINSKDQAGFPSWKYALNLDKETFDELVARGLNPTIKDKFGETMKDYIIDSLRLYDFNLIKPKSDPDKIYKNASKERNYSMILKGL